MNFKINAKHCRLFMMHMRRTNVHTTPFAFFTLGRKFKKNSKQPSSK